MGRWAFASISWANPNHHHPYLRTTEPAVADEVFDELKKLIPSARMYSDKQFEKLGMREASFDRLEGLDGPVGFWIIAKMCELGWEPIGSNQFRRYYGPESTGPVTH